MPPITIRQALPGDESLITEFNLEMAQETEGRALDRARLHAGVSALLRDPLRGFYLLARLEGSVAGQLLITFEWSDWRNASFWWVQSVFVRPEFRRRGVFRALFAYAQAEAKSRGDVCGLRLYVERANTAAQSVYLRLGMEPSRYELLEQDFVLR